MSSSAGACERVWRVSYVLACPVASRISRKTRCRLLYVFHNIYKTLTYLPELRDGGRIRPPSLNSAGLNPIPRLKKFQRLCFARSWFGFVIVHASNERRQTHQNGFGSSMRL